MLKSGKTFIAASAITLLGLAPLQAQTTGSPVDSPEAGASDNTQNEANNPLTPKITINFQDYYIPSFNGLDGKDANQFLLRGLIPLKLFGASQLLRFTLPIAHAPTFPTGGAAGVGDLTLMDLFMFPGKPVSFGLGPILVAPTASDDALGTGRWQIGAAGIAVAPQSWGLVGALVTYQQSFADPNGRDDVKVLTAQPIVMYNLPNGFYLRSSAIWSFDFEQENYYIPVGLGIGKVFQIDKKTTANLFIEPQYSVYHHGDATPRWQIFGGINFQFAVD